MEMELETTKSAPTQRIREAGDERPSRPTSGRSRDTYASLGISRGHNFDYKDVARLKYFVGPQGKILPRRMSGLSGRDQRSLVQAINRARQIALLPFGPSDLR